MINPAPMPRYTGPTKRAARERFWSIIGNVAKAIIVVITLFVFGAWLITMTAPVHLPPVKEFRK